MPMSQLFEVTIDAAGVSTSKRVSKLYRKNRHRLSASGVMESSSLPLPPVLPGPGRACGSARKPPSCISVTNAEVTKYSFLERVRHYMGGKQIDTYNRVVVEACIFVEVGTVIKDLETMKIPVMEELFYNKYF